MTTRTADQAGLGVEDTPRNVRPKLATDPPLSGTKPSQESPPPDEPHEDSLAFVDFPDPDPRDIHGWSPQSIFENLAKTQRDLWIAEQDPKLLVYKAYGGKIESLEDMILIGDMIKTALDLDTPPAVAPPIAENPNARRDEPPFCALVTGISQATATILILKKFISTPDLSLFFIPFSPEPSMFITTLKGFLFPRESKGESETEVKNIISRALFDDGENSQLAAGTKRLLSTPNHRNNVPPPLNNSVHDSSRFLKASIVIRRLDLVKKEDIGFDEAKGHPAWNVYIAPPTKDHEAFKKWVDLIRSARLITKGNGAGLTKKIFTCSICRSKDHPGGMCPFPSTEGWSTPTPPRPPPIDDIIIPISRPTSRNEVVRRSSARAIASRPNNARGRSTRP